MTFTDEQRAALARQGLAVAGSARGGLARSGLTLGKLVLALLAEQARLKQLLLEQDGASRQRDTDLQQEIEAVNARLAAYDARLASLAPGRRRGQEKATAKKKQATALFVRQVDRERRKSDEITITEAVRNVLRRIGVRVRRGKKLVHLPWNEATPLERKKGLYAAVKRYRKTPR